MQSQPNELFTVTTFDLEGKYSDLADRIIEDLKEAHPDSVVVLNSAGDHTDKGPNNVKILLNTIENYNEIVLGNRDFNLLKRLYILTKNLGELILPEIEYYNNNFAKAGTQELQSEYINKKEYKRPSNLMWSSSNERLLQFLIGLNYLEFDADGKVKFNQAFNHIVNGDENNHLKRSFRLAFLIWDCTKNQAAPGYVYSIIEESLQDKCDKEFVDNLIANPKLNIGRFNEIFECVQKIHKESVVRLLEKAKIVYDDSQYFFHTHSAISEDVLYIPMSFINLMKSVHPGWFSPIDQNNIKDYTNKFNETTKTYKVETIEFAAYVHNYAWRLCNLFRNNINQKLNELANAAEKDFIEFALPNNPQGFCTASQINNGSERRTDEELISLEKIVSKDRKLLINFVGHKPTEYFSAVKQEINGLTVFTLRGDISMNGGGVVVTRETDEEIDITCVQSPEKSAGIPEETFISAGEEIRTQYSFDKTTGKLSSCGQIIDGNFISLPLASRFHEKDNNQEWRVVAARKNESGGELEYIITSVNGDESFKSLKGDEIRPFSAVYRCVSESKFFSIYDKYPEVLDFRVAPKSQVDLNVQANKKNIYSYRYALSVTALAGVGLTVASLLTELPFAWHVGVAVAAAAIATLLLSVVIKLVMERSCQPNKMSFWNKNSNTASQEQQNNVVDSLLNAASL